MTKTISNDNTLIVLLLFLVQNMTLYIINYPVLTLDKLLSFSFCLLVFKIYVLNCDTLLTFTWIQFLYLFRLLSFV